MLNNMSACRPNWNTFLRHSTFWQQSLLQPTTNNNAMVRPTKHALDAVGLIGLIGAVGGVCVFEPSTNTHGQIQSEYQLACKADPNMVVLAGWVSISNMVLAGWVSKSSKTCVCILVIASSGWLFDSVAILCIQSR